MRYTQTYPGGETGPCTDCGNVFSTSLPERILPLYCPRCLVERDEAHKRVLEALRYTKEDWRH